MYAETTIANRPSTLAFPVLPILEQEPELPKPPSKTAASPIAQMTIGELVDQCINVPITSETYCNPLRF